jgi:hypothetical protein
VREDADPVLEEVDAAGSAAVEVAGAAVEASLVDEAAASGSAGVTHTVSDAGADAGAAVVEVTAALAAGVPPLEVTAAVAAAGFGATFAAAIAV